MHILITATSYLPMIIQEILSEVMAMAPRPDSIPFKPASMLVRLAAIETAINDFSAKAAPKVANYKANESSLKAIADLSTKFEAAKKVVG